jgi:hypothetical protein
MLGDIYCHIVEFDTLKMEEVWRWVRENKVDVFPGNSYVRGRSAVRFRNGDDAMMFKLVFGG